VGGRRHLRELCVAARLPFGVFLKSLTETCDWSREAVSAAFGIATMTVAVCSPALGMRSGTQANSTIRHVHYVSSGTHAGAQRNSIPNAWLAGLVGIS